MPGQSRCISCVALSGRRRLRQVVHTSGTVEWQTHHVRKEASSLEVVGPVSHR
jgi:hypothetical protein